MARGEVEWLTRKGGAACVRVAWPAAAYLHARRPARASQLRIPQGWGVLGGSRVGWGWAVWGVCGGGWGWLGMVGDGCCVGLTGVVGERDQVAAAHRERVPGGEGAKSGLYPCIHPGLRPSSSRARGGAGAGRAARLPGLEGVWRAPGGPGGGCLVALADGWDHCGHVWCVFGGTCFARPATCTTLPAGEVDQGVRAVPAPGPGGVGCAWEVQTLFSRAGRGGRIPGRGAPSGCRTMPASLYPAGISGCLSS